MTAKLDLSKLEKADILATKNGELLFHIDASFIYPEREQQLQSSLTFEEGDDIGIPNKKYQATPKQMALIQKLTEHPELTVNDVRVYKCMSANQQPTRRGELLQDSTMRALKNTGLGTPLMIGHEWQDPLSMYGSCFDNKIMNTPNGKELIEFVYVPNVEENKKIINGVEFRIMNNVSIGFVSARDKTICSFCKVPMFSFSSGCSHLPFDTGPDKKTIYALIDDPDARMIERSIVVSGNIPAAKIGMSSFENNELGTMHSVNVEKQPMKNKETQDTQAPEGTDAPAPAEQPAAVTNASEAPDTEAPKPKVETAEQLEKFCASIENLNSLPEKFRAVEGMEQKFGELVAELKESISSFKESSEAQKAELKAFSELKETYLNDIKEFHAKVVADLLLSHKVLADSVKKMSSESLDLLVTKITSTTAEANSRLEKEKSVKKNSSEVTRDMYSSIFSMFTAGGKS